MTHAARRKAGSATGRLFALVCVVAGLLALSTAAAAQTVQTEKEAEEEATVTPLSPPDTSSPRATLKSLRDNHERTWRSYYQYRNTDDIDRAANVRVLRTLDMSKLPPVQACRADGEPFTFNDWECLCEFHEYLGENHVEQEHLWYTNKCAHEPAQQQPRRGRRRRGVRRGGGGRGRRGGRGGPRERDARGARAGLGRAGRRRRWMPYRAVSWRGASIEWRCRGGKGEHVIASADRPASWTQ